MILVILAIIIPPVAVLVYEGATGRFWLDLIFALVGIGLGAVGEVFPSLVPLSAWLLVFVFYT